MEVRQFLGLATYYRRFIENLSKIAKPLTALIEKDKKKIEWVDKQETAFQKLKKCCVRTTLSFLEVKENFIVYCDASMQRLGCVLMRRDDVITYTLRQLKTHENNNRPMILSWEQ